MKVTVSAIKADIGSIGGHTKPSQELLNIVKRHVMENGRNLIIDSYIGFTGDDIHIIMTHTRGDNNPEIHKLAFDAFLIGTQAAKEQSLYGAGQDILKTAFSGNVKGMGPGVAEMTFEERPGESFIIFAADKTEPGAFNVPLYYMFAEVSRSPGLILSNDMRKGVTFTIMDAQYTEKDKIIKLKTPENYIDIASLLFNPHRFMIESIFSINNEPIVSVSTTRLHNIAGKYVGKDDPIMIVRVQRPFLATEEVGAQFKYAHFVAGDTRGSHNMSMMPVKINSHASVYFCNPLVSGLVFSCHEGKLVGPVDAFDDPIFDEVRRMSAQKSFGMRDNGFVMPAMLPMEEIEYTVLAEKIKDLEKRFVVRDR
ncbi:fructose-1,6-bisphosphatase [Candidatus Aenigmatarchaeota archaeon]